MEGMFMVQTEPFPTIENMKEYVKMLFLKYVRPHFVSGVIEVHVIFDNPGALPETPKELEQKRRDMKKADSSCEHECFKFSDSARVPLKWRPLLSCRKCKQNLTEYAAGAMLNIAPPFLSTEQEFITNIKEMAFSTNNDKECMPIDQHFTLMQKSPTTECGYTVCIHRVR